MIWLVVSACAACFLLGVLLALALAAAAGNADRRRGGMIDFTFTGDSSNLAAGLHSASSAVERVRPYTDKGQSAA